MKKVFLTIIVTFMAIILFSLNSYAEEETIKWTDFNKAKIEITKEDQDVGWNYYFKITGITLNEESQYKVYIKSGDTEPDFIKDEDYQFLSDEYTKDNKSTSFSNLLNKAYSLNKDVYCYIIERNGEKYSTPYKTKLPRLEQHDLGSRIKAHFFSDRTSTFNCEAGTSEVVRNIKVKIGTITDKNILLSIQKGEKDCLQKLLNYAKSAKSIYTGVVPVGNGASITSKFNVTDKEYYYVYMEMDDEGGKYYPVEEVSLYQGLVSAEIGKNLYDYLSDEFKWNIENGTPTTPPTNKPTTTPTNKSTNITASTTKNNTKTPDITMATGKLPKTGIGIGLISLIIIAVSGLIFAYFKYDRLKGI